MQGYKSSSSLPRRESPSAMMTEVHAPAKLSSLAVGSTMHYSRQHQPSGVHGDRAHILLGIECCTV